MSCDGLNIPKRLHQNNKSTIPKFDPEEKLFRRFSPDMILPNGEVSITAIDRSSGLSFNREYNCGKPEDVLYNIITGEHFFSFRVGSIKVRLIESYECNFQQPNAKYNVKMIHKPEECMYPHSEVSIIRTTTQGTFDGDIPSSKKLEFRNFVRQRITPIKPTP